MTEEQNKIPSPLMKHVYLLAAGSIFLLTFAILYASATGQTRIGICGVVLSLGIAGYAIYMYLLFRKKKYIIIDGICIDARAHGYLQKRLWQVVIEDTASKDIYGFDISNVKKYRVLPGDRVYLYMPEESFVAENEGILTVLNYYGYEVHR